jgi:hypothetical protein
MLLGSMELLPHIWEILDSNLSLEKTAVTEEFMMFLSTLMQMLAGYWYSKLGTDYFLPYPFHFTIHHIT